MSCTPLEIAARMATIRQWMDAHAFAALQSAIDDKLARSQSWV